MIPTQASLGEVLSVWLRIYDGEAGGGLAVINTPPLVQQFPSRTKECIFDKWDQTSAPTRTPHLSPSSFTCFEETGYRFAALHSFASLLSQIGRAHV